MVVNRPLDVDIATADLKSLTLAQRVLRQQWEDAVASGATKAHPYAINRDTTSYPSGVSMDADPYAGYDPTPAPSGGTVDLTPVLDRLDTLENAPEPDVSGQVSDAIAPLDTRLEVVEEALPEKVTSAQVDTKLSQMGSKFRGDWSAGELAWSDDFSGGLGPMWTKVSMTVGAIGGGGNKPSYSTMIGGDGNSDLTLDVSKVPALVGKQIVQVKFWWSMYRYIGGDITLAENGVQKWSGHTGADSTSAWAQALVALSGTGNLRFLGNGSNPYLTGFEIYIAAQPYMLGEFVLSRGKMWKSKANNNSATPGQSASWEEVPVNFNQVYTTAARPSASAAGDGAQIYDGDLDLALWSNGSVWKDAAGTTR